MGELGDIPYEILVKVFDYIQGRRELQECQLICRKWSRPAQEFVYKKMELVTDIEEQSLSLTHELNNKFHLLS